MMHIHMRTSPDVLSSTKIQSASNYSSAYLRWKRSGDCVKVLRRHTRAHEHQHVTTNRSLIYPYININEQPRASSGSSWTRLRPTFQNFLKFCSLFSNFRHLTFRGLTLDGPKTSKKCQKYLMSHDCQVLSFSVFVGIFLSELRSCGTLL